MTQTIDRYFLDISSINNLNLKSKPSDKYLLNKESKNNFDLNKFFYKQIGKKHQWTDRLIWQDKNWIDYVSNEKVAMMLNHRVPKSDKDGIANFIRYDQSLLFHCIPRANYLKTFKKLVSIVGEEKLIEHAFDADGWNLHLVEAAIREKNLNIVIYLLSIKEIKEK